ncbi:MAG: EAL domain-containing protein [Sphingobium sp.]|nr:EAL domain-containing protein [Sphingobium sp.]
MVFVRPRAGLQPIQRPSWQSVLGAADDQDGRAIVRLSQTLRRTGQDWAVVLVVRLALVALFLSPGLFSPDVRSLPFQLALGSWFLADLAIICAHRFPRFDGIVPNGRLWIMAGLVFASALTSSLCAAMVLKTATVPLLIATLTPALPALSVIGRLRALAMALAAGASLGLFIVLPDPLLIAPYIALAGGLAILLGREYWRRSNLTTQQPAAQGALSGERAKALLEEFEQAGRGWFWETDRTGKISYISETLAAQVGRQAIDLFGTPFADLIAASGTGADSENQRTLGFHFSARTAFSDMAVRAALDGEERWWSISGRPIVTAFGQFLGFRGNGSDLTEMRRSQAEVARLASVDALTGLANRPQMMQVFEQALNSPSGRAGECALFLLDLDRFKEVNDTMGHPAGDALLRQVAQRLLRLVGSKGKVGRIGGDEFKIILPGMVEMAALAKLADAIIRSVSEPYEIDGSQVVIGVSIGIALAPTDGESTETLIRNADLALYTAKGGGRGQFRFFMSAMHAEAEDRRQLEGELRQAILTGSLHLEYQPVVCAASERVTGFETFIRWHHPVRGAISPAVFIPIAEEAGLIGTIGEWVLRTACIDAMKWPKGTRLAVNVSPMQFANPALPSIVVSALANSGLSPAQLELEITESVFLSDRDNTDGMFAHLKNLGIRLALDDFGTGYSALGYLKTASFDKIKIDQSFVRGAAQATGNRNAVIVKSIVSLAEALGMETTAEGAETLDELDFIRSLGCSHIQGFVYGRPMSMSATLQLLAEHDGHAVAQGHKSSREPRMTMLRTVTLTRGKDRYTGRIRNVSPNGALIEGLRDVPVGTTFNIEFGGRYSVNGHCRWSKEDRMGVEFDTPVSIDRIRAADKPAPVIKRDQSRPADRKRAAG